MIQAVIFDIDGTLVDNMPFHVRAWMDFFRRRAVDVTERDFEVRFAGSKNEEILRTLLPGLDGDEARQLAFQKEEAYRAIYRPLLTPLPGLMALMDRLDAASVAMGVASAAPAENRELVLDGLSIRTRFRAVVGSEHAARGKPFPDLFLRAAEQLDVDPARCLAVEDALNGVRAGRAAGMEVLAVTTGATPAALIDAGATWTVPDFVDLPAGLRSQLFDGRVAPRS